jgi:hypothetical protein
MTDPSATTSATPATVPPSVAATTAADPQLAATLISNRYLIRFGEDTLKHRPLWVRVIIEFVGTFFLVTVAAGAGVITTTPGEARSAGPRP